MILQSVHTPNFIKNTLSASQWEQAISNHEQAVEDLVGKYLEARSRHEKNPIMDFLFQYYAFRPSMLKRWSPGLGTALEKSASVDFPEFDELIIGDDIAWISPNSFPKKRIKSSFWIYNMLINSKNKRPSFGCFGMHEWAMVYKCEKPRHNQLPLRMPPNELAEFVESRPLLCTHFDAFRFFTKPAQPMNKHQLTRDTFSNMEQAGCIHTNMDLYKWAFKLYPWIGSDLILRAFKLAYEARMIDMQASPYDLSEYGHEPIKIETEAGRKIYKELQETIYEKGKPIRDELIEGYKQLLQVTDSTLHV